MIFLICSFLVYLFYKVSSMNKLKLIKKYNNNAYNAFKNSLIVLIFLTLTIIILKSIVILVLFFAFLLILSYHMYYAYKDAEKTKKQIRLEKAEKTLENYYLNNYRHIKIERLYLGKELYSHISMYISNIQYIQDLNITPTPST